MPIHCPRCKRQVRVEAVNDDDCLYIGPGDFGFCDGCKTMLAATLDGEFRLMSCQDFVELNDDDRQELRAVAGDEMMIRDPIGFGFAESSGRMTEKELMWMSHMLVWESDA